MKCAHHPNLDMVEALATTMSCARDRSSCRCAFVIVFASPRPRLTNAVRIELSGALTFLRPTPRGRALALVVVGERVAKDRGTLAVTGAAGTATSSSAATRRRQPMEEIDDTTIRDALKSVDGWERVGHALRKTFSFPTFPEAITFVNQVALIAEQANHHPDMDIRWTAVSVTTTTHSANGLTQRDLALVHEIERAIAPSGAAETSAAPGPQGSPGESGSVPGTLRGPSTSPLPAQEHP